MGENVMNQQRVHLRRPARALSVAIATALLTAAPGAFAQSAAATLRGQIAEANTPAASATVKVTNANTGFSRTVQAQNGSYSVGGLPPGTYQVDVDAGGKRTTRSVILQVGQTATLDLDVTPAPQGNTEEVTVTASQLYETKTSEVG